MNKKIFFLLSLVFVFNLGFADIFQASKWRNEEGKIICVYHDRHRPYDGANQLNYLYNNIFTKFEENKPGRKLLVLSECHSATWADKQIRTVMKRSVPHEVLNRLDNLFLVQFKKMFYKKIQKYLIKHNIDIVNIDNRECLTASSLVFRLLRPNIYESLNLTNFFSNKTLKNILQTAYDHLFSYRDHSTNEHVRAICSDAIEHFEKESQAIINHLTTNIEIPELIVATRPFSEIRNLLFDRLEHQQQKFTTIMDSFPHFFSEIIETNALIHILLSKANQDVAIFLGGGHALKLEKRLPGLGYEHIDTVNAYYTEEEYTPYLVYNAESINHFDSCATASFIPISNEVFNWILE